MSIDPGDPMLLFEQLVELIKQQLVDGTLPPRRKIPTQEQLADAYGVSRGTVLRATASLTEEGLLTFVPGRGLFTADADVIEKLKRSRKKR